jgi:hypothetical protein
MGILTIRRHPLASTIKVEGKGKGERQEGTCLRSSNNQRIPIDPRQNVIDQLRVRCDGIGDELAFFGVEGEAGGGGLAGFYGAG